MNWRKYLGIVPALGLMACGGSGPAEADLAPVIKGVNYVGVSVSDLDKSVEQHMAATDLVETDRSMLQESAALDALAGREGVIADTRMLRTVNAQLRFMTFQGRQPSSQFSATPVQGPGIAHVCHQVAQDTETYQRYLAAGAKVIGAEELVQLSPRNPVYYAYVHDRDNIIVEVEHVDVTKLDQTPANQYRLRHVSLATPDIDRLVGFYSVLLAEPKPRRIGGRKGLSGDRLDSVSGLPGSQVRMAWFQVRNLELEIFQYVSHPTEVSASPRPVDAIGYNMIVFDVDDLDKAAARLVEAGGTIETEAEEMDGGRIIFGRDPDGNILGLQAADATAVVSSQNFSGNGTE